MALTDACIRSLKPANKTYKRFDGGGLYIEVRPSGYKCWKMKFCVRRVVNGEMKSVYDKIRFGEYPSIGLHDARLKRDEIRRQLDEGIDPNFHAKIVEREALQNSITFDEVGEKWWNEWRKNKAHTTCKNRKRQIKPYRNIFGKKPIKMVDKQTIREPWNY